MKIVAACLLAVLGGKTSPTADDIKEILASVGANADENMIELLISQIKGKDITELVAVGREKLACAGVGMGLVSSPPSIYYPPEFTADDKKEPAVVEEKEESDDDFMISLFD
ncbi:60S acidic ribosomal protein P2B-like [Impatiens glandulifera]|uniref:60S acidic ribosomal protein P2B-like n=1 Tax=Impatiens glandulifera TaxID=253017 RepID=UPI001FB06558|nr:60S acidic ribosomal protein P2B-like [Impatiens glandulifera]